MRDSSAVLGVYDGDRVKKTAYVSTRFWSFAPLMLTSKDGLTRPAFPGLTVGLIHTSSSWWGVIGSAA